MAMDAKMSFVDQMEKELADRVTVQQMEEIRRAVMNVADRFDMREIRTEENGEDDMIRCYLSALSVQCRSENTIARYEYIIRRMLQHVGVPTRRITVYHLRQYLADEKARGISDSTLEGLRQVFSAYFNWLQREALIDRNPTANLGTIKKALKVKKTYTDIDIEKLMNVCRSVRDRAIIHFLASTGCRISEMTGLDRDAVDLERLECVVHGKGNKERTVFLSPVAGMWLAEYMNGRKDEDPALFVSRLKERLRPGGVREMLNVLAREAGVEHVHPHKFRRTLATDLARHGMPIQEIAALLGHEKLDTTLTYVVRDKETIRSNVRRYA